MASIVVGSTTNFAIQYEDQGNPTLNANLQARAQVLLNGCEIDLYRLKQYFPVSGAFGEDKGTPLPITVTLKNLPKYPRGADNSGYSIGEPSSIDICALANETDPLNTDFVRFLFIAEMAELLMWAYGWHSNKSFGEAFSRVLATEFYPASAYDSRFGQAPWVNSWLNARTTPPPAPDWVGTEFGSDVDQPSYGCGILFIYYLRDQLQYP